MALQAKGVHVGAIEQPGIGTAMRCVARGASLGLHYVVLINKGARCFGMTLGADCILLGSGFQALPTKCSVRIVAVRALHQALFNLVMEGHAELRLDIGVALEAEPRLSYFEEMLRIFAGMYAVAADATHVGLAMARTLEVSVLALVATQAFCIHFFGGRLGRVEYLGDVSAPINVRFTRSVTAFAGYSVFAVRLGQLGVRIGTEFLTNLFVAGRADFLPYIVAWECLLAGFYARSLGFLCRGGNRRRRKQTCP